ncbi:MAG TPA: tetratricopeptide repeat protein [Cytophagaceae bacterium]|nr:tetratricopeptide repeat protein [Cytophagaceae bacterium]
MRIKLYISSALILLTVNLHAQHDLLHQAVEDYKNGDLVKAQEAIDKASQNSETAGEPKVWYYKGAIYKDIYKAKELDNHSSGARINSVNAFIKCISLGYSEYHEESRKAFKYLASTMYNDAARDMNAEQYKMAFLNFESYLEFESKVNPAVIDTMAIFHAGYTAYMDHNYDKAIKYLSMAMEVNYHDPALYYFLGKSYLNNKDYKNAEVFFTQGIQKYPDDRKFARILVNLYQESGKQKELANILTQEIPKEPGNTDYLVLLGITYEKLMAEDSVKKKEYLIKAGESYSKALKIEPDNLKANYNLGLLYYNQAVDKINVLPLDTDLIALEDIQQECKDLFKQALPFMEKAYQLNPRNKETLIGLSGIYFSLHDIENSNRIKTELNFLEK